MRNFKARISKLEKNIEPRKKLYKIYWANGTFVGEYWSENGALEIMEISKKKDFGSRM